MPQRRAKSIAARSAVVRKSSGDRTEQRVAKQAQIATLLKRRKGATIADLMQATGWQVHSVRAALTGLRKRDVQVERERDKHGNTVYRIASGVSS